MWVKYAWYASYNYSYVCLFAIGKVGSASFAQQAEPPGSLFQLGYWYHILIRGHCFILFAFDHTPTVWALDGLCRGRGGVST